MTVKVACRSEGRTVLQADTVVVVLPDVVVEEPIGHVNVATPVTTVPSGLVATAVMALVPAPTIVASPAGSPTPPVVVPEVPVVWIVATLISLETQATEFVRSSEAPVLVVPIARYCAVSRILPSV
jgi:hypothetical protein